MALLDKVKENEVLKQHGEQYKDFLEQSKDNIILSPSGLRGFVSNRGEWYQNVVMREKTFTGNKSSTLGNLIHTFIDDYYNDSLNKDGTLADWKVKQIAKSFPESIAEFERLYGFIKDVYLDNSNKPDYREHYLEYDISDTVKLAGSFDAMIKENDEWIIIDYKSSGKSFKDMEAYILQLSVYALLVELCMGIKVSKLRIIGFITTKEPRVLIIEDKPNIKFAKELLNNVMYALNLAKENEDLKELLFPYNYFDMFSSEKRLGSKEPMFKELDKTTVIRNKLKQSVFG